MRPQLKVLTEEQISKILAEAKRLLAEVGIEVRGKSLRERLLAAGLKENNKNLWTLRIVYCELRRSLSPSKTISKMKDTYE